MTMNIAGKFARLAAVALMVSLTTGCAQIVSASPEEVQVDTGQIGEIVPGVRHWISWLDANEHCSQFGKKPKLIDLKGAIAVYRCVPGD